MLHKWCNLWPIIPLEQGFRARSGPARVIMAMQLTQKSALDSPAIPDRLYFKIGDVARICQLETYVLRFWETQFPQLKPNKSGTGQRLYRRRDVELALRIKHLVHIEGYTLAGARQVLGSAAPAPSQPRIWIPSRSAVSVAASGRSLRPAPLRPDENSVISPLFSQVRRSWEIPNGPARRESVARQNAS